MLDEARALEEQRRLRRVAPGERALARGQQLRTRKRRLRRRERSCGEETGKKKGRLKD